jgi:hypothetical protein
METKTYKNVKKSKSKPRQKRSPISIQSSKSGSKMTRTYDKIYYIPEDTKSRASYLLLKRKLRSIDSDYIYHNRIINILKSRGGRIFHLIKMKVFSEVSSHYKTLTCTICQREDLIIPNDVNVIDGLLLDNHATIEHIEPVSLGGLRYAIRNMTCTCNKCNQDRKVSPLRKIGEHHYTYET